MWPACDMHQGWCMFSPECNMHVTCTKFRIGIVYRYMYGFRFVRVTILYQIIQCHSSFQVVNLATSWWMKCVCVALTTVKVHNPYQSLVRAKASLSQWLNQIQPPWILAQVCLSTIVLVLFYHFLQPPACPVNWKSAGSSPLVCEMCPPRSERPTSENVTNCICVDGYEMKSLMCLGKHNISSGQACV